MPTKRSSRYLPSFQKILSLPPLLKTIRNQFEKIIEPITKVTNPTVSLPDVIMSGFAIFSLKYPSLLQFDKKRKEPKIKANLANLFGIKKSVCDTQMRERLDEINHLILRPGFVDIHKKLQSQHVLNEYHYLDNHLLFAIDGTTYYQSEAICCEKCNVKNKTNGKIEYSHQALGCSIVHPEKSQVFPLFHEEIRKEDGESKNDCEQNAVKRYLPEIRKVYPTQKITILEDSLFATAPHVKLLISLNFSYIIAAKPGDHAFLFKQFEQYISEGKTEKFECIDKNGTIKGYRYSNDLPLNDSNQDVRVNFIEHWEIAATGRYKNKRKTFTYITDHSITKKIAADIAKGGRTRSKIENETFNTLKNQDYHFEHNYGHGKKNLSSVFVSLMFLAFLIDQIQEACCEFFQAAHKKSHSRIALWERVRGLFLEFYINKWEDIYLSIIYGHRSGDLEPDILDTS